MLHANSMALFYRTGVIVDRSKFYIAGIDIFDLDPMTIYALDPNSLEIHRMCKYELPMLGFRKLSSDRQTRPNTMYTV